MARESGNSKGATSAPMERLKSEARGLLGALGDRALSSIGDKVEGASGRLTQYVEGGAGPGLMAAVTGTKNLAEGKSPFRSMLGAGMAGVKEKVARMFGKGKGGGQRKLKLTNIVESVDVGVPVTVAYNQWTQYSDFPKFTKKVESVDQNKEEENKTNWKAQVFWSHRTWEATVVEQVPDERIIWRSKGQKGHVDGAVTFHELTPNLTRILLVLEYHPQGMFERTGNLWRAQGRRARLELKHFRRYVMTESALHADDIEGWRGVIHDGEVVESHEDVLAREEQDGSRNGQSKQAGNGRADDAARDRAEDAESEDVDAEDAEPEDVEAAADDEEMTDEREDDEDAGDETRNGRAARRRQSSERPRSSGRASRGKGNRSSSNRSNAGQSNGRRRAAATTQRGGSR
jgi:uncharacterized membrane protein